MSTDQREAHEEYSRQRIEAARAGRVSASLERIADEVALAEAGPVFALDSAEHDAQLLAGLVNGTSPRKLVVADD